MTLALTKYLRWDDPDEPELTWDIVVPEPRLALEGEDPDDYDSPILVEKRVIHRWGQQCCLLYYSDGHVESWYWQRCPHYSYREGYHISYRVRHEPEGWLGTAPEEWFPPDWDNTWADEFNKTWPCWEQKT